MRVKLTKIQELDEKGWKDYYYLGKVINPENTNSDEWKEFKTERLDQYNNLPPEYKIEECLVTYSDEPIGWLAFTSGNKEHKTYIFDNEFDVIPDNILKDVLILIYVNFDVDRESVLLWSKNPGTNHKLKQWKAEIIHDSEGESSDCQFNLTKSFLEKHIK